MIHHTALHVKSTSQLEGKERGQEALRNQARMGNPQKSKPQMDKNESYPQKMEKAPIPLFMIFVRLLYTSPARPASGGPSIATCPVLKY